ncbi:MAG: hypothetical protein GWP19_01510 [Planctomycetia bacterium]|nr:hypothetical protein [Planctomycetia bacterium]
MAESRGTWTDLVGGVGLEIAEVFDQGQEQYIPGISNLLIKTNGEGAQRNFTGKTGAGRLKQFDDGDNIKETRRYKTYTTQVEYTNYAEYIEVTKNQIQDRDFSSELDEMKDLSISANFSQDEAGMQLFNGGYATTTAVNGYTMTWYGDGVPQFSTKHPTPVPGQSVQSNASSTGIKFGDTNLETARVALTLQKTDDNIPTSLLGKMTIVLPFHLDKTGQVITGSTLTPEDANNSINIYKGGGTDMITSPFLDSTYGGSDTAWSIIVPQRAKLYHEIRQTASLEQETNIKNKMVTFTVDARWANYSKDWRRSWGSKGDLASYSS